jgi:hypothetical protein
LKVAILFEQRNARKDPKKNSWKWLFLRKQIVFPESVK